MLIYILVNWIAGSIQRYFRGLFPATSYSKSAKGNRFARCLEPGENIFSVHYVVMMKLE